MSGTNSSLSHENISELGDGDSDEFVTMTIFDQLFGIPVSKVQDVLGPQIINKIPLAPPEVAGSLNLRGRIVTAIDIRKRLGLPPRPAGDEGMNVVVEQGAELYSLVIDTVGEVLSLPLADYERNPSNLDEVWRDVTAGIYQLDGKLMVVVDIDRLLDFNAAEAA
jgi:purine-binding chemotaxis protein CheW